MVLSIMRRHAKSWLIKFLITIIALVFVFYFGYSFTSREGTKIAYVNGELISGAEYQKAYGELVDRLREQYKDYWNDNLIKAMQIKTRALEYLINQKLLSQEAERLGMTVTKDEIQKAVMKYPAFQVDGRFDMDRYRLLLSHNRMSPENFEMAVKQDLLQEKLRQFVYAFMEVSDQEVEEEYRFANQRVKISYVQFMRSNAAQDVKVDEKELESYFKENQSKYGLPEEIKLTYIEIDPQDFRDQVTVTDEEVSAYYDKNIQKFTEPEEVRARHIFFELPQGAPQSQEKTVHEKAEKVLKEVQEGKDFATLAAEYSEDPTKSKGGDLGFFPRGRMDPKFEEAAFSLKPGEVSGLVRSTFGYHIIKVEEKKAGRVKPLSEVQNEIRETLIKSASSELAHEKALSLMDRMPYDIDLVKYAQENKLKSGQTDYFDMKRGLPQMGIVPKMAPPLFALQGRDTSGVIEAKGKYCIFQVADRKAPRMPELKEVRARVEADYVNKLRAEQTTKAAQAFLDALHGGKSWDALVAEMKLDVKTPSPFKRREPLGDLGYLPEFNTAAFTLSAEKPYPDKVVSTNRGTFVLRWLGDEAVNMADFEKSKDATKFSIMQEKHRRAFESWLTDLKNHAKIEIISPVEKD